MSVCLSQEYKNQWLAERSHLEDIFNQLWWEVDFEPNFSPSFFLSLVEKSALKAEIWIKGRFFNSEEYIFKREG